jgi:hypothetical protein
MLKKFNPFLFNLQLFADGEPGGGGGTPPPGGGEPQTFSADYVKGLRGENAKYRTELRTAKEGHASLEGTVRKFLGAKEGEEITDYGKAFEGYVATQAQALSNAQAGAKNLLLKAEVKVKAAELGIIDPEAAAKLADLSKVQVADDGIVTGVGEALEALLTSKPYLKGQTAPSPGGGNNPPGGNPSKTLEQQLEEAKKEGNLVKQITLKNQIFERDHKS